MSTLITTTAQIGTIKDATGNTTAMTIDSSGRVKRPNTPHIFLDGNNANWVTHTANDLMTWLTPVFSSGITFSNGIFSVPVAGIYWVSGSMYATGAGSKRIALTKNSGTTIANGHSDPTNSSDDTISVSALVSLTASDTFKFVLPYAHQVYQGSAHCYASAYLID